MGRTNDTTAAATPAIDAPATQPEAIAAPLAEAIAEATPKTLRTGDVFPAGVRAKYAKGKAENGKRFFDSGDDIATKLRGATLLQTAEWYAGLNPERNAQGWIAFYTTDREARGERALNNGMVRMNIGNRIRALLKDAQ
jgi:hypothetical protein